MSELLALLTSFLATSILAAVVSSLVFRDYREGFRILYHLIDNTGSHSIPRDAPKESRRSLPTQLLFAAGCLVVATVGYLWLAPLFAHAVRP